MPSKMNFPTIIFWGVFMALILAVGGFIVIRQAEKSRAVPVLGQVADFQAVNQDGQPFGLNDLKGKVSIVDFIFTSCQGVCPIMSGEMSRLYRQFEKNHNIRFVSITVDPENDSLSVLQNYARAFDVNDERWVFLWQPKAEMIQLSEKGFLLPADNLPEGHSRRFVLVDQQGQIRGYYDSTEETEIKKLIQDIAQISKRA